MSFTIFIEEGLHAGAVQRLGPGIYTIGSELDSDIVLTDPDVEPVHVILEFDDTGLRLEPAKGAVSVEGETGRLEPGDERYLSLPAKFHLGDAAISIRAPKDAVRNRHRKRLAVGAMAASVLFVLGLYVVGPLTGSFSGDPVMDETKAKPLTAMNEIAQSRLPATTTSTAGVAPATANRTDDKTEPAVTVDMAAAGLRDKLAAATLDAVDVIIKKDHLVAKGAIDPEKMADWQTVQMWFDGEYGRHVPLMPSVEASEEVEPPKLAIEAVWAGDGPYLMAGGRRYFEGTDIGGGWRIDVIRAEQITLRRGDQTYAITL